MAEKGISTDKFHILSASTLKLLACAFMLIDHVGMRLFPKMLILRIIGRLAFPIFAFFIAEGCRYTRDRRRHFLSIFILGAICETVYIVYMGGYYGNILLTFSVSILLIYAMQECGRRNSKAAWAGFGAVLAGLFIFTRFVCLDYGFTGVIAPLLASLPECMPNSKDRSLEARTRFRLWFFGFGIMLTALESPMGHIQLFALLSLPLLATYNNKPGSRKLKYFFYIFYPVHLLLIELANMLMG